MVIYFWITTKIKGSVCHQFSQNTVDEQTRTHSNLQSLNVTKVEIEGFKKVDEIKRQIDLFNGDGVSLILVKER